MTRANLAAAIALAVTIASSSSSMAGPAPIWDGLYLGGHGGWADGSIEFSCPDCTKTTYEPNGVTAGGHLGYNFTVGSVLLGVEGDFSWSDANIKKRFVLPEEFAGGFVDFTTGLNYLASVRGRIGIPIQNMLFYATAGVAWTELESSAKIFNADGSRFNSSQTRTLAGFVVGGGLEAKFTQNLSGRIEGLYYGFEDQLKESDGLRIDVGIDITVVRAGLSYHFN